ncbi:hypothetical protein BT96DRAFT_514994 [Gymnopus androsaceus JB14]|uniref:Uncharacterized protein n=1 Tax=Gymnopus androsaceus JB14 TaxID=1447944 RepID=A0A6A4HXC1_9AGAR|nr:hypothetical protein BT96DRAFT_514994 [Gymnopus androsaceus JB14]
MRISCDRNFQIRPGVMHGFLSEPVKYSEVWQKSIEHGGLNKWCTRSYFPKPLSELELHSSTNPDYVDILFTLPHVQSFPASVILESHPDGPHELSVNLGPQFLLEDFLHAAVIVNPSVDLNAEVYFVRGHAGNRARWKEDNITIRHLYGRITPNDKFIIVAPKPIPTITEEQRAYLQIPSTSDTPSTAGKAEIFRSSTGN